jgi:CheY-like chemotaxis protein
MGTGTPEQPLQTTKVVFVDGDPFPREALADVLRTKGFAVHVATDGLAGLQLIRMVRPDVVLLDIILPKINGSRLCRLLRQDPQLRPTPIIALSGLAPQDLRRFPELSADAYVAKGPLSRLLDHLLQALRYVEERGPGAIGGGIFGYEGFHPRRLVSEMVAQLRRYESLIQMLGVGVLELDAAGRILMATPAAATCLGKREARLIAEPLAALVPARERRVLQEVLEDLQRSRTGKTVRVQVSLGAKAVSLRFSSATDEGVLTGILVTISSAQAERHSPAGRGG